MNLDDILDNIDQYADNIDDLVRNLKQLGINSIDEFKSAIRESGISVSKSIRDQVATKFANSEEDDWNEAKQINTEDGYLNYLRNYPDGKYRDQARNNISNLKSKVAVEESDNIWNSIDKDNMEQLRGYIANYPESQHLVEAWAILRELQKEEYLGVDMSTLAKQINTIMANPDEPRKDDAIFKEISKYINTKKIKVNDLLETIKNDNNFISGNVAYKLWYNGIITDFRETGIAKDFIKHMMSGVTPVQLSAASELKKITKVPSTEIYFWGIPSSGKSCAIGAILSTADNGKVASSMMKDPKCQGFGYMNELSDLFGLDNEVGTLPERTQATLRTTYEMGFELQDKKGLIHPITCIDIAGEVFCDMHKLQSKGKGSLKSNVYEVLQTLNRILIDNRTSNRKIHFFVIEYGAEDRKYRGVPQKTYLNSALAYIIETGIFEKDTDAVYILVTKVDKANATGEELRDKLENYISSKYDGFLGNLKRLCYDKEINDGKVDIHPFTLGDVCFQSYFRFHAEPASKVVETILKRSFGYKPGKLSKLINKFRS
ncbi:MAG: hypothetical protein IJZ87_08780 [Bacteroidales bacterium]|nr:hypothetical protein [Bacteroidales bacterium]